ncbi:MAG: glutaminase, partial [Alphaproteobacteria bacterium]|nr:glutaminase [Alphaproteobacteria bacterium]
ENRRTADVWADSAVRCIELPLERFYRFRDSHPQIGEQIMRNLAGLLVRRLGRANRRIDLLSSH